MVVPTFNEEASIATCLSRLADALTALVPSWEIVVADDGSIDRTVAIAGEYARQDTRVRIAAGAHLGKGGTLRRGLQEALGQWRLMADADLAMPPGEIARFLDVVRADPSVSLVIGSREGPGSQRAGERPHRRAIGRAFNLATRCLVVPGIADTQCGFKLFSADAVRRICPQLTVDGFAFDVEMLAIARREGLIIREVGITWCGRPDSRVSLRRGGAAFVELLGIRWRTWMGLYGESDRSAGASTRLGPLSASAWAYVLSMVFGLAIAYDLWRMPIQVNDALGELLDAQVRWSSPWEAFWGQLGNPGYLRPLRTAQIKGLFDASGGHYWVTFRGFQVALLLIAVCLFTRALRVRTATDLAAAAFALTVLTGLHTFRGTVQEAYPINHFLEIVVWCLAVLNLSQSRGGRWVDVGAVAIFLAATLTLESGLLVLVVAVAAWLGGRTGISRRGLAAMALCFVGYLYVRFVHLATGVPTLIERSSGYLFDVLEVPALQDRFGDAPLPFYAYNVLASLGSVLFSEPQGGVLVAMKAALYGEVFPRHIIQVLASILTTALLVWAPASQIRERRPDREPSHLIPTFALVLLANAVLSFAYTKDDIMSVAGVFYALACYAAIRGLIRQSSTRTATAGLLLVLAVTGPLWTVRSVGLHNVLRWQAFRHRKDWARLPGEWTRDERWPADARQRRLVVDLRDQALAARVGNQPVTSWADRVWGD